MPRYKPMGFILPQMPKERDLEIYYDVAARGMKQSEVAKAQGLSAGRICQIVSKVRAYIVARHTREEYTTAQVLYAELDAHIVRLDTYERMVRETFVEQHSWCRKAEETQAPKRPPRADPRLIAQAMAASQSRVDAVQSLTKYGAEVKREFPKDNVIREDLAVNELIQHCDITQDRAKAFTKYGVRAPEMPTMSKREIELHIRNKFRTEHRGCDRRYLPEEWADAMHNVWEGRLVLIGSEEDVALRSLRDNPHFFDNSDQPHELEAVVSAKDLAVEEAKEEPVKEKEGDGRPAACPTQGKEAPARVPIAKKPYGLHQGRNPPPEPEPPKKPRNPNSIPWHGLM